MRKELKAQIIENIAAQLEETPSFYVTDIAGLNAEVTAKLRRACFEKEIKLLVVKNTLFYKVLEQKGIENLEQFGDVLKGSSAIMFTTVANAPARLIKEFSKENEKPVLKAAFVQDCTYFGADQLDTLVSIKSREELIGDIIGMLQAPAQNVISALQSQGGGKIAGIVKTLSEKE
ncbi:MAG: 50S ribosomal protein L10 [Bacteroidales bacterium]|nr:50S ribosomal protein L10 [Bacteroidales bacterium]MBQ6871763.1 50S ribosomal protein L10 [Bacteroidales bacterium]MBQ7999103.1 50S ribosomal protein L10 [Bacteroidales bacterium]MBQ8034774.1 50S ribosomal protein L10 [Bacteroidales bacterium]MBR4093934.1 50S ribosomal protein L10 [Bacteroidales bacterium]